MAADGTVGNNLIVVLGEKCGGVSVGSYNEFTGLDGATSCNETPTTISVWRSRNKCLRSVSLKVEVLVFQSFGEHVLDQLVEPEMTSHVLESTL